MQSRRHRSRPALRPAWPLAFLVVALLVGAVRAQGGPGVSRRRLPEGVDIGRVGPRSLLPVGTTVDGGHVLARPNAGEVQSAVVPPAKKAQCPAGRLVISDDSVKSPAGLFGIDLDSLDGAPVVATVDGLPDPANRRILSNDHDLLALPDGDLVLIKMGQARTPLSPKPAWFDHAYKLADMWGPGARSVLFIWRSQDCGASFQLRSAIDLATLDDGWGEAGDASAGGPQGPCSTASPGSFEQPIWVMGGTDGPEAKVDPVTGRIYAVIGVVGYQVDSAKPGFFLRNERIPRSVVVASGDGGDSWERANVLPFGGWRTEVVPGPGGRLRYGTGAGVFTMAYGATEPVAGAAPPEPVGWAVSPWADEDGMPKTTIGTNVGSQAILLRSPGSDDVLLAYPVTLDSGRGHGYRVRRLADGAWHDLGEIAPAGAGADDFIFHLTVVDPGSGPVLLYWYDVDVAVGALSVRGRFIPRGDRVTPVFQIAPAFTPTSSDWFGDYHGAAGFVASGSRTLGRDYEYYPVWIQQDGVRFARVTYHVPARPLDGLDLTETPIEVPGPPLSVRSLQIGPVEARTIDPAVLDLREAVAESRQIKLYCELW